MVNLKVIHVYFLIFGFYICQNFQYVLSEDASTILEQDFGPEEIKGENIPDFVCHAKYSCFPLNKGVEETFPVFDKDEANGFCQQEPTISSTEQNYAKRFDFYDADSIVLIGPPIYNSTLDNDGEVVIPVVEIVRSSPKITSNN